MRSCENQETRVGRHKWAQARAQSHLRPEKSNYFGKRKISVLFNGSFWLSPMGCLELESLQTSTSRQRHIPTNTHARTHTHTRTDIRNIGMILKQKAVEIINKCELWLDWFCINVAFGINILSSKNPVSQNSVFFQVNWRIKLSFMGWQNSPIS